MGKRRKRRVQNIASSVPAIIEEKAPVVMNAGIGGGINPIGFPFNQGTGWGAQISQSTTEFVQLRWYLVSNMRQLLSELYVEIGLVQTITDVPVDDALRGGVEIKSKQLDEDQIAQLLVSLDRDDDLNTAGQAAKWNRLFGGAGILILTDQDPEEPLEMDEIGPDTPLEFRAVDMWELFWDKQTSEGYDPAIQSEDFDYYNYYGEQVHKSRVMRLKGLSAPSFIRPRLRGWGFSVVEALVRSLNQYLKAQALSFEVLDEFKVDVYKIKNLVNTLLSPQASQKVNERIQQTNYNKNYQNAIVMDSEDDWDHKQLSFAGLAEAMEGIRIQVASDMRMPLIKLFGVAASGLNANDESGIEVYNSMVESQVRNKIKYDILRMCEIKCQKLFGFVPDDMSLAFKPLRVMSAEQEENVKTQKFNRLSQAATAGQITLQEYRDACNKGNLFDVTLDNSEDNLDGYMSDKIGEGKNNPYNPQDIDNPGADRLDTRKSRATEVGGAGKEPPAPDSNGEPRNIAKFTKNSDKWEESKHPRADDGKFGKGGGQKTTKGKDKPAKQKEALDYFKGPVGYRNINAYLSGKDLPVSGKSKDEIKEMIATLDTMFSQTKLDSDQTVYRGMRDVKDIRDLGENGIGKTIDVPTYWSTSPDKNTAADFMDSKVDKNGALFELRLKKGQSALDLSEHGAQSRFESELLLPHNVTYKIVDYKPNKKFPTYVLEIVDKAKNGKQTNSAAFDRASYEADGGDRWIDDRRKYFFEDPTGADESLWERAKEASRAAYGKIKWQFVAWFYKKQGGKFD